MRKLSLFQKIRFYVVDSIKEHFVWYAICFTVVLAGAVFGVILGLGAYENDFEVKNYFADILYGDAGAFDAFLSRIINFIVFGVLLFLTYRCWKWSFAVGAWIFIVVYKTFKQATCLLCVGGVGNILCGILFYVIFDLIYVTVFLFLFVYIIILSKRSCRNSFDSRITVRLFCWYFVGILLTLLYSFVLSTVVGFVLV